MLNFYPYYEKLLKDKLKWTTIRLGDQRTKFAVGDLVMLTIGWSENENNLKLYKVQIQEVYYKRIKDLNNDDLDGESPDCTSNKAIPFVISAIYRKVVSDEDYVTVIKWKY